MRVFPLSNWTELDIWRYIRAENIPIVDLYFARRRPFVQRDGMIILAEDERLELWPGEVRQEGLIRFRTLGCFAAGLLLLGLFVPLELRIPNPLVDIRTASQPVVIAANTISVFMGFAMFVNMLVSTQLLQTPKETATGWGSTRCTPACGWLPPPWPSACSRRSQAG